MRTKLLFLSTIFSAEFPPVSGKSRGSQQVTTTSSGSTHQRKLFEPTQEPTEYFSVDILCRHAENMGIAWPRRSASNNHTRNVLMSVPVPKL